MLFLTCEHASARIPARYRRLFGGQQSILRAHRGWDIGSAAIFSKLRSLANHAQAANVSRLLVDLNRSIGNPKLFSEFSRPLNIDDRREILDSYYYPYRNGLETALQGVVKKSSAKILHLAVHSFTPRLNHVVRQADIGLLYDPARPSESRFTRLWKETLLVAAPTLKVRFNYPYRGIADGLTTYLRRRLPGNRYSGIELEINQKLLRTPAQRRQIGQLLYSTLKSLL